MTNLKAIIVDEERLARVNLRRLLEPFPEISIAGEASCCKSALELVNLKNPQLIFLDIQLHGETCYDLLELIDDSINVIFVTALDEIAIHTFNMNSSGYLSKPVNPEQLKIAIERVKNRENNPKIVTHSYEDSDGISVQQNNKIYSEKPTTINMPSLKKHFLTRRRKVKIVSLYNHTLIFDFKQCKLVCGHTNHHSPEKDWIFTPNKYIATLNS